MNAQIGRRWVMVSSLQGTKVTIQRPHDPASRTYTPTMASRIRLEQFLAYKPARLTIAHAWINANYWL